MALRAKAATSWPLAAAHARSFLSVSGGRVRVKVVEVLLSVLVMVNLQQALPACVNRLPTNPKRQRGAALTLRVPWQHRPRLFSVAQRRNQQKTALWPGDGLD